MLAAFLAGLLFCALVWRSGSLWPAIGMHVAVNIIALTVLGLEGDIASTQLWIAGKADYIRLVQADIAMLLFVMSQMGRIFAPGDIAQLAKPRDGEAEPN